MHSFICILLIGTVLLFIGANAAAATDVNSAAAGSVAIATPAPIATTDDSELDDFDFESDSAIGSAIPMRDDEDYASADETSDANHLNSMFDGMADVEPDSFSEKEKRIKTALLKSTGDKRNRQIFTQILPILRSLSKSQRTALAALVSAQLSLEAGQELSFDQAEGFFGDKRKLILPIILDIANIIKSLTINVDSSNTNQVRAHHAIKRSIQHVIPVKDKHFVLDTVFRIRTLQTLRTKRSPKPKHTIIAITESDSMKNYSRPDPITAERRSIEQSNVHVTLPITNNINRTNALDEYEDLTLGELNGTDSITRKQTNGSVFSMFNVSGGSPEAAMLISGRTRHPSNNKLGPGKQRSCELFGHICLRVEDYPLHQIMRSINRHKNAMSALLAEHPPLRKNVNIKTNDVAKKDILANKRRESDDYDEDSIPGGMCPSIVRYARPQKARSAKGEWKYIVNTGQHTQTLRLEKCSNPDNSCSYLTDNFKSRCLQIYNYHRLLSWDSTRGLHVDIFKVPTCCSCHIDGYREEFPPANGFSGSGQDYRDDFSFASNKNKYSTIFDDDDDDDDFEDYDTVAKGSVAYQYSNGFRKTPATHSYADIKFGSAVHAPEIQKKSRKPTIGSYLTPPTGNEFNGDGSFQRRTRRPQRKHTYDQPIGNGFHQNVGPSPYADHQTKRRVSIASHPSITEKKMAKNKLNIPLPSISTASTSAQDLGKRVNYNYHPIIDFFSESVPSRGE